jgi:hypothetical protein
MSRGRRLPSFGDLDEVLFGERALAEEGRDVAVVFGGVAELDAQAPGLDAFAVRPSELGGHVGGHAFVMVELRLAAAVLLLGIEQAIAFQGAVGLRTGGAAVEVMPCPLGTDQHQHEQVHQNRFARAGHAGQHQVALHRQVS